MAFENALNLVDTRQEIHESVTEAVNNFSSKNGDLAPPKFCKKIVWRANSLNGQAND